MRRLFASLAALPLLLAVPPERAVAFGIEVAIDGFLDDLSDLAREARDTFCANRSITPEACIAAMVANDITSEFADPTPCGGPGQSTCLPGLHSRRFIEIGGSCERGLFELPYVVCVAPPSATEAIRTVEDIKKLTIELAAPCRKLKSRSPLQAIELVAAIKAVDAEQVERIIRDSQYFDEDFAIMKRLGFDTAGFSLGGGGFFLPGAEG